MNIGLVAHDSKKKLMQNFCIAYRGILAKNELFATGTTSDGQKVLFESLKAEQIFAVSPGEKVTLEGKAKIIRIKAK